MLRSNVLQNSPPRPGTAQSRDTGRMNALTDFPITKKWPAQHPQRLQLYSLPTPNGVKVSIMLEETGLPYEPHLVNFGSNDQMTPEFLSRSEERRVGKEGRSRW